LGDRRWTTIEFLGYVRPNEEAGIRNYVLIVPSTRLVNIVASRIAKYVNGTKTIITGGENGRHKKDRMRLRNLYIGLSLNANVYGTIVIGAKAGFGYAEFEPSSLAQEMAKSGKPVRVLMVEECGGLEKTVAEGIALAREMVQEASRVRREPVPIGKLAVGVKCGLSDATSGISGNPTFGRMSDLLVTAGGTVIFSETVELIGAELDVAARCEREEDARRLLEMVHEAEEAARATGEDIRTINPLPSNIQAGISTLEEKSLGAIQKSGTSPIRGVLEYAQRPPQPGLYFMDGWMSSFSLPMSLAAAGCQLVIYQLGGEDLPSADPPMLATNTGVVAPLMMMTGNPRTAQKAHRNIDFSAGGVITGECSIAEAGEALLAKVCSIASGEWTKGETVCYEDPLEPYFLGPVF